ncbi:MAG TPA: CHC2 zinc finger domain-containing protein, partial [Myxococcaceae bacterium]|nr:CHC2 zinc finger domain-containing protein [Myxococcaceae bacterium]
MIPEHKIQEVLERVDLVGLVSRYVELKKAGREYKGRCPFHQEKTPSFYVVPEKRFYFC